MPEQKSRAKVLLVEDEHLLRMFNAELLEDAGFEVIEAANAHEALRQLERHDGVAVLFTDVDMPPGVSGVELAEIVHQRWPDIGLVVTSGHSMMADAELPDDGHFIPKLTRPDVMVRMVQRAAARG